MYQLEEDAKKKACPFATVLITNPYGATSASRSPTGKPYGRCLAKDCAMWVESAERGYGRCGLIKGD
jgi:hypothetical protein